MQIPDVPQAEVYIGKDCVLIRNRETERVVKHTGASIPGMLYTVPDLSALLEEIHRVVRGERILLAFGDSVTANIHNWPHVFYRNHLGWPDWIALNLAHWARPSDQHVPVLEFFLDWLRDREPAGVTVVVMLGLRDVHDRLRAYQEFLDGGRSAAVLPGEERLREHRYGQSFARLLAEFPTDWEDAEPWIARRIFAGVRIMQRLCHDAGAAFFALLEPAAYEDCSPSYGRTLRQKFAAEAAPTDDFATWCGRHRYVASPSTIGPRDHRPFVEALRGMWRRQSEQAGDRSFQDWTALFRNIENCCFQEQFDAVHYSSIGAQAIAAALGGLLQPDA